MAFGLCSMTAAVGGLLMTARLNAAEAAMGDAYGLQTVAAVVIGGTSMLGGEGGVLGTLFGGILLDNYRKYHESAGNFVSGTAHGCGSRDIADGADGYLQAVERRKVQEKSSCENPVILRWRIV